MGAVQSSCNDPRTDTDCQEIYDPRRGRPSDTKGATRAAAAGHRGPPPPPLDPKEAEEKAMLLMEIRALQKRVDRNAPPKETTRPDSRSADGSSGRRRHERGDELSWRTLAELRQLKKNLETEDKKASAEQDALEQAMVRRSLVRKGTAEEAERVRTASASSAGSSGDAAGSSPPKGGDKAEGPSKVQLVLEDPLLLVGPDLLCDRKHGVPDLRWDHSWADNPAGPRDEGHRRQVRLNTREKVKEELGLSYFGEPAGQAKREPPALRSTVLYRDVSKDARVGAAPPGGLNLLGRYDVCVVKTCADLDRKWNFLKGAKQDFWVAHAAAVNVGESVDAPDFADFQKLENEVAKTLDEWKYIEAMGHISDNIVAICNKMGMKNMVFFPFGMGAFLRHLGRIDARFTQDEEMLRVRRAVAARMVQSWAKLPKDAKVHLCLQFGTEEAQRNADGFLRALVDPLVGKGSSPIKARVVVIPEGDVLDVASALAATLRSDKVLVVNGANRQLIGNHWFAGRAKMAIDENLHRRSWRLSAIAYLLNEYDYKQDVPQKAPDTLAKRVEELGGKVVELGGSGSGAGFLAGWGGYPASSHAAMPK